MLDTPCVRGPFSYLCNAVSFVRNKIQTQKWLKERQFYMTMQTEKHSYLMLVF